MNAALALTQEPQPRRKHRAKAYAYATELQTVLHSTVLDPATKPADRAACARAWEVLEERKRILRGRPLPGHLRPELMAKGKPSKRVALLAQMIQSDKESTSPPDPCPQAHPPRAGD